MKRLPATTLKNLRNNGIRALRMEGGDQLIAVRETDGSQKILIATHDGMAVCFDENDVRPMGRDAVGCGASACEGRLRGGRRPCQGNMRCCPSRKTATASRRRWRTTGSPTGAASASRTTW